MAEDFNMDFMGPDSESSNKYRGLINFLKSTYGITIENNVKIGTTRHGSGLDAIFSRNIKQIVSKIYCFYFSYHRPIVSIIQNYTENDRQIVQN